MFRRNGVHTNLGLPSVGLDARWRQRGRIHHHLAELCFPNVVANCVVEFNDEHLHAPYGERLRHPGASGRVRGGLFVGERKD